MPFTTVGSGRLQPGRQSHPGTCRMSTRHGHRPELQNCTRRRQILAPAFGTVILYAVDEFLGVFEPYADSKPLGFQLYMVLMQITVYVAGRVSRCKNHGAVEEFSVVRFDTFYFVFLNDQFVNARAKMYLAARLQNSITDILDDAGQLVGTYVGVCIGKYGRRGPVLAQNSQDTFYRASLLAAGIEFPVGKGTGSALAKTVVRLVVDDVFATDAGNIFTALVDVLSPFQYDWAHTQLDEP